jgi:hypothetical protein
MTMGNSYNLKAMLVILKLITFGCPWKTTYGHPNQNFGIFKDSLFFSPKRIGKLSLGGGGGGGGVHVRDVI